MKRRKPLAGHRCKGAQIWICVKCECGWVSANHGTKGARARAFDEWRAHVESCAAATPSKGAAR